MLSLAQGLGKNPGCRNSTVEIVIENKTVNITMLEKLPIIPNYSVQVYFIFMFLLLCIATAAFSCLHFSPLAIRERKTNAIYTKEKNNKKIMPSFDKSEEPKFDVESKTQILNSDQNSKFGSSMINEKIEKCVIMVIIFMVSFICYGVLPGLQSYSTLPYGE